ncbi:Regulator of microtubule dynamics protein 1 [Aphelenchoides bicaudatus]|nr:Regulator of microtubule dynamics protein 1 [Aphelenchoides bicaudatus]
MFRRAATTAGKLLIGAAGSFQMGAAAVALTDKQLSKKPEWYRHNVLSLEESLKKLSTYTWIESEEVLNEAEENLKQYVDSNNPEILWRLARTLTEKASLIKDEHKKAELLHQAVDYAEKAIKYGGKSAHAFKWYAISACYLRDVDKKAKKCPKLREKINDHLKRATELDKQDPFSLSLLGIHQYHDKNYKEALESFKKAESIKPGFSLTNLSYLGRTQYALGQKSEATESLKKAFNLPIKNKHDGKAKSETKSLLLNKLKQKQEDFEIIEAY